MNMSSEKKFTLRRVDVRRGKRIRSRLSATGIDCERSEEN